MRQKLKYALRVLKTNTQLLLVSILLVIFPFSFIFTLNSVIDATRANTNTVITQKINTVHDTIEILVRSDANTLGFVRQLSTEQNDLIDYILVSEKANNLTVLEQLGEDKIGTTDINDFHYKSALIALGESFLFPLDGQTLSKVVATRALRLTDDSVVYLTTEHDFSPLLYTLDKRISETYYGLTFIFIFLLLLAYWIIKQINYRQKYEDSLAKINEKDLFIDGLAHEFRTPLTAIRGYSSLISETDALAEARDFSSRINNATNRLITLVNDFLEVARIQSGKVKLSIVPTMAGDIIDNVITELKPLADIKNLSLETNLPPKQEPLNTDRVRLQQILTNIVNNAIKYTASGSVIVSLEQNYTYTTITVADTGGGISAEDQKKLFRPFSRVGEHENDNETVGSGLGMWVVKQLTGHLNGEVYVESIKGVGTHVIIKFKNLET
ncbi:MAG: HAMP domain-containing histidine kinase [Candidatus Nomurabacteria bacterium]|nr:MAG: HAMP domain-containing histidine kinase [Candidatus Nomurabacteria bacterium]